MKKRISQILLANIILFFSCNLEAQELGSYELDVISKNIVSYHFRFALNHDLDLKSNNILDGEALFFEKLWVDESQDLKLEYFKSTLSYPLQDFELFEVKKRRFQIGNDSTRISYKLSSLQADEIYLVAMNTVNGKMKFISGNFFLSSIQKDFNLNFEKKESFKEYIKLRTYNWSTDKIKYKKSRKGKMIFSAYSAYLKDDIFIKVDKNDFENIQVHQKRKKITY